MRNQKMKCAFVNGPESYLPHLFYFVCFVFKSISIYCSEFLNFSSHHPPRGFQKFSRWTQQIVFQPHEYKQQTAGRVSLPGRRRWQVSEPRLDAGFPSNTGRKQLYSGLVRGLSLTVHRGHIKGRQGWPPKTSKDLYLPLRESHESLM